MNNSNEYADRLIRIELVKKYEEKYGKIKTNNIIVVKKEQANVFFNNEEYAARLKKVNDFIAKYENKIEFNNIYN